MNHRATRQTELLKDVWEKFDVANKGEVLRAEMLVAFSQEPGILLEKFPRHVTEIQQCLEMLDCVEKKEGVLSWETFSTGVMRCLEQPGGRFPVS